MILILNLLLIAISMRLLMTFDICNIKIESHFNIVSQIIEDKRAEDACTTSPLEVQVRYTEYSYC